MFHAKLIWGTVEEKIDGKEEEKKKNLKQISSYQQAVNVHDLKNISEYT